MPTALAVLAHPDDAEFLCAGTLARLAAEHGWAVHVATLTAGDCGSAEHTADQIARIRRDEGATAAARIGAAYHCLGERDLLVFHDEPTLRKVTRLLREVAPALVLTHAPSDYHIDHEATSRLARAAAFAAPVPLFDPGPLPPLPHIPHLYYCDPVEGTDSFGDPVPATTVIDISPQIDLKTAMLACHASQRNWMLKHHGVDEYLDAMRRWSARRGGDHGFAFAEGFRQHRGHGFPADDVLAQLLGSR